MGNHLSWKTSTMLAQKTEKKKKSKCVYSDCGGEAVSSQCFTTSHCYYSICLSFLYCVFNHATRSHKTWIQLCCPAILIDLVFASLFPYEIATTCDLEASVWLPAVSVLLFFNLPYLLLSPLSIFLTFCCVWSFWPANQCFVMMNINHTLKRCINPKAPGI